MNPLQERERSQESKFAHDAETHFKDVVRRNRLLGLWAAGLLGQSDKEAEAYAESIVKAGVDNPDEDALIGKLLEDLGHKAGKVSIREKMEFLMLEVLDRRLKGAA